MDRLPMALTWTGHRNLRPTWSIAALTRRYLLTLPFIRIHRHFMVSASILTYTTLVSLFDHELLGGGGGPGTGARRIFFYLGGGEMVLLGVRFLCPS